MLSNLVLFTFMLVSKSFNPDCSCCALFLFKLIKLKLCHSCSYCDALLCALSAWILYPTKHNFFLLWIGCRFKQFIFCIKLSLFTFRGATIVLWYKHCTTWQHANTFLDISTLNARFKDWICCNLAFNCNCETSSFSINVKQVAIGTSKFLYYWVNDIWYCHTSD